MEPTDEVSLEDLSALIGVDLTTREHLLESAIEYCWRQGIGLKRHNKLVRRLTESEKVDHLGTRTHYQHNWAGKTLRRAATVDFATLTPLDQHRALALATINAQTFRMTADEALPAGPSSAQPLLPPVPLREYQGLFKGL
jgi:hypothetical protein